MKSFKNDLGYAVYGRVISGLLFITDWQKHDFITIYYKVQLSDWMKKRVYESIKHADDTQSL